ncbi:MAG: hypothetical protein WD294_02735 [Phycisphaeraceae bacterium]
MHATARVNSIDMIRRFRPALVKFADQTKQALTEAQSDVQRTAAWLEQEQGPYWQQQVRKRQELVQQARQAISSKKSFEASDVSKTSTVDEERALRRAQQRLEEAEQKVLAVKKWRREIDREWMRQQGALQRLGRSVEQDIPRALALLERLSRSLEAYVSLTTPSPSERPPHDPSADAPSVARTGAADPTDENDESQSSQ